MAGESCPRYCYCREHTAFFFCFSERPCQPASEFTLVRTSSMIPKEAPLKLCKPLDTDNTEGICAPEAKKQSQRACSARSLTCIHHAAAHVVIWLSKAEAEQEVDGNYCILRPPLGCAGVERHGDAPPQVLGRLLRVGADDAFQQLRPGFREVLQATTTISMG